MALQVGELFVKLKLDSNDFANKLDLIEKELKTLAKSELLKLKATVDFAIDKSTLSGFQSQMGSLSGEVQRSTGLFSALGTTIQQAFSFALAQGMVYAVQQVGNALGSVVTVAATFESEMSAIKAVLQPTGAEFDALREKALQLGQDTVFSATESAQAINELGKQGLTVPQILGGAADATVALAAAVDTDLANAATIAADTMNVFRLEASQLASVVDGITGVTITSKFTIDDFRLALANGGGAASQAGISITDFNAAIAATASQFSSGQTAGTAFRTFINRLTPNTQVAAEAMRELGLITADGQNQFYTASGELKSMAEVAGIVQTAFAGLTSEQRNMYIETVFGQEALGAVIGLMIQGTDGVNRFAESIADVSAADIAATRLDNFNGAVEQLKGAFDTFLITVGDQVLPVLTEFVSSLIPIVNIATQVAQAIFGSQEAFSSLSPSLQTAVIVVQEVSSAFSDLASQAYSWGSGIANQFGAGLLSAASAVVNALMEMGSWVSYWLEPQSPPRITPDLDKWGAEAATIYFESFQHGDYSSLSKMGDIVRSSLESLVSQGTFKEQDVIPTVLGTREAYATALQELRDVGSVSEATFEKIIKAAGDAGESIRGSVESYFELEAATQKVTQASEDLARAQEKVNELEEEYNKLANPLKAQKERADNEIRRLDILEDLKDTEEIIDSFGGDDSKREKAKWEKESLEAELALLDLEESHRAEAVILAELEEEKAKKALEEAQALEDKAKEQYNLEIAKLEAAEEYNDLVKEQIDLLKKLNEESKKETKTGGGGGGGSQGKTDAEKAKEAQDKYNYSLANTEEKLAILKDRLAGVEEGSAEYYEILGQIDKEEKKLAKEREDQAKEIEDQAKKKADAERDYRYSIADTQGKLAILREELAGVEEGSVEYYKILGDIARLEEQERKKAESAAAGGASGGGGGGAGGGGGGMPILPKKPEPKENPLVQTVDDAKQAVEEARATFEKFMEDVSNAKSRFKNLFAPLAALDTIFKGLRTKAQSIFNNLIVILTPAINTIVSIVNQGIILIQGFWNRYGAAILADVLKIWTQIERTFNTILELIGSIITRYGGEFLAYITENQDAIQRTFFAVWTTLSQFVNDALVLIQRIIQTITAGINKDWDLFWNSLYQVGGALLTGIWNLIINILNIIAGTFGTSLAEIGALWSSNWTKITEIVKTYIEIVYAAIVIWFSRLKANWDSFVSTVQAGWNTFWDAVKQKATDILNTVIAFVITKLAEGQLYFDSFVASVKSVWNAFWNSIKTKADEIITAVVAFVLTKLTEGKLYFESFVASVKSVWNDFWTAIKTKADEILRQVISFVVEKLSGLESNFDTTVSNIKTGWDTLSELPTKLGAQLDAAKKRVTDLVDSFKKAAVSLGVAIIDGIIKGIADGIARVVAAAKSIASAAIGGAEEELDSNSPSKEFIKIGNTIPEGTAIGMDENMAMVDKAVANLGIATVGQASSFQGSTATRLGSSVVYNIDARGSTMNEAEFRKVIIQVTNEQARKASRG